MKAHLTKVSLALLSTVFLLGCQEQGAGPMGPEGPLFDKPNKGDCGQVHCHDDDEDPQQSMVTLTVGMQAGAFPVGFKDSRKTLGVGNYNILEKPDITMAFVNLVDCKGFTATNGGTIPVGAEFAKLVAQLTEPAVAAQINMSIVKDDLGSESDHTLTILYDDEDLGEIYIMLGGWPGPVKVEEGDTDVFTFTGPVMVRDPGNANDNRLIRCPGQTVTVTLNR